MRHFVNDLTGVEGNFMATLVLYPKTSDSRLIHLNKPSMLIGCTPVADICLESESVSDCHARIEHKPDGYYVISLSNTPGVFVNGVEITFQRLRHGDKVEIGDVTAEFLLADEDTSRYEEAVPREMMLNTRLTAGTNALVASSNRSMACPQCGLPLTPGVLSCPRCGQPISTLPMMPMDFIPPTPMSQSSAGLLPVIAFLAALTIVGAPIALVLGLITLSIIRRRGGTIRDLTMAKWSIGLGLFWIMIGVVAAGGVVWRIHKRAQLNSVEVYEAQVIRSMKNLACAEKYAHTIEFFDTDSDGYGEYGELSALAEIQSPFFDTDLSNGKAYGYHFTIREASEGQFLAVAEPTHYESTGGRTFAIDQSGQIRGGDSHGNRFGQISSVLPVLQGERSAYYEIDDEIAKDVLNYVKAIPSSPKNEEKKQRILTRLRKEYSLTSVGRELEGLESTVNRFVTEQRAQAVYLEAQTALAGGSQDVALAKLAEIQTEHPSFSKIAAVERELIDLRSAIAQRREMEAQDLFTKAEAGERQGMPQQEVQQLFQRIEKLYPDTDVAARITSLKPELQRQLRERNAEELFSVLMELSPESKYEKILSQANQLRRNYSDTDLFGKAEAELTRKERKARASAWRFKTLQNIEAGRMRGALAQLESAMRENPDLQYDLRDLCTQLYREVADKMAKEGDARGALGYYTQANRLLQASNSKDQISPELLAKLHNDVGLADYERKDYTQARWHLASAAWKYQEDAQFNMRLGAASLYSGLYRPAEEALTLALTVRPDMEPALLYRAYLNMRIALALEKVIGDGLQQESALKDESAKSDTSASVTSNADTTSSLTGIIVDENGDTYELDPNAADTAEPDKVKTIRSRTRSTSVTTGMFSPLAEPAESSIPEPTDLDLVIHYSYDVSRNILPDLLQFIQDVQSTTGNFAEELKGLKSQDLGPVKLGQLMQISEFRNQLSDLRAIHLQDLAAQKKLFTMMEEMKQRVNAAMLDIQAAGGRQPRIQSMAEHIIPQINTKCTYLFKATDLLTGNMDQENQMRGKVFKLAEDSLRRASSSSTNSRDVSGYIKGLFYEANSVGAIDQALLLLRDSMEINVDLKDILRTAEGNAVVSDNGSADQL
jgi:hypothetical protein